MVIVHGRNIFLIGRFLVFGLFFVLGFLVVLFVAYNYDLVVWLGSHFNGFVLRNVMSCSGTVWPFCHILSAISWDQLMPIFKAKSWKSYFSEVSFFNNFYWFLFWLTIRFRLIDFGWILSCMGFLWRICLWVWFFGFVNWGINFSGVKIFA